MRERIQSVDVGPALVAVPVSLGNRRADKRQPYSQLHRFGSE
jgi:hypothetical protein